MTHRDSIKASGNVSTLAKIEGPVRIFEICKL